MYKQVYGDIISEHVYLHLYEGEENHPRIVHLLNVGFGVRVVGPTASRALTSGGRHLLHTVTLCRYLAFDLVRTH